MLRRRRRSLSETPEEVCGPQREQIDFRSASDPEPLRDLRRRSPPRRARTADPTFCRTPESIRSLSTYKATRKTHLFSYT